MMIVVRIDYQIKEEGKFDEMPFESFALRLSFSGISAELIRRWYDDFEREEPFARTVYSVPTPVERGYAEDA